MATQSDTKVMSFKKSLRHNEYYNIQDKLDELYERSSKGLDFQHLFELITSNENIMLAYRNIKRNRGSYTAGTNGRTIEDWEKVPTDVVINYVRKRLENFKPMTVRRVWIPKPDGRKRPLGIPTIEDRLIQQCFKQILEPICEAKFHRYSYGFRPNRKTENAINNLQNKINLAKCYYILNFDIKGFFDNVNHGKLIKQLWTIGIHDKKVISIIKVMLKAEIENEGIPDKGIPQGGILSPILANVVLNELDWWISSQWEDFQTDIKTITTGDKPIKSNVYRHLRRSNLKEMYIVRYADDFKIICRNKEDAKLTYIAVIMWLKDRLKLKINEDKSGITDVRKKKVEFLGFKIKASKKHKKYVARTHMSDRARKKATKTLKTQIKILKKQPTMENVFLFNSLVSGLQNYYQIANQVNTDFRKINYDLLKTMRNRIKPISNKNGVITNDFKRRYKNYKGKIYYVNGIALYPISYINKRDPMGFNQQICDYTIKGRNLIHKNLSSLDINMMTYIMEHPIPSKSIEYNDNRLSLYSAQKGKCAVSGIELDENMEAHHIIPVSQNGSDEYKNLILVTYEVHKLIHATKQDVINKYMNIINPNDKVLKKLNKYRKKVGNFEIER